jgi:uncharacterized protein
MSDQLAIWQDKFERIFRQYDVEEDGSHDLTHLRRVLKNANLIADEIGEPICRLTLLAAVWLHDIVSFEKNDPRRVDASRFAAMKAKTLLEDAGVPPEKLAGVTHAIEAHSFSANIEPQTVEAMILQDADRLDALGAVGIARVFYVGGRIGRALYHGDDILANNRALDDLNYSLDHFQTKILTLPESMKTAPGRRMAGERTAFVRIFLEQFCREAGAMDFEP